MPKAKVTEKAEPCKFRGACFARGPKGGCRILYPMPEGNRCPFQKMIAEETNGKFYGKPEGYAYTGIPKEDLPDRTDMQWAREWDNVRKIFVKKKQAATAGSRVL